MLCYKNSTFILPGDTRRAMSKLPVANDPFVAPNQNAEDIKCIICFTSLQSDMVF